MSAQPDQIGVALLVGAALDSAGSDWLIGGSVASSAFGEPRSTHDVDLAAALRVPMVRAFVATLGDGFYADEDTILDAAKRRTSFNVIHYETTEKIDVFCVADAFARHVLRSRVMMQLPGERVAPVARAEHMIVEKLRWYRRGGEVSGRQLRDVAGILRVMDGKLDMEEVREWASKVGVADLLVRLTAD